MAEARGRFVAYCCDRDLWLPDHLECLRKELGEVDWAHTNRFTIRPESSCVLSIDCDLSEEAQRQSFSEIEAPVALSCVGHTLDAYRRLPFGWRETPKGLKTDHYMWLQFLSVAGLRARSSQWPTVLYFNRGSHPGLSTQERFEELKEWVRRLPGPREMDSFRQTELERLRKPGARVQHALRSWFWWHPKVKRFAKRLVWRIPGAIYFFGLEY